MDGIAKKSILRKQVSLLPNREKATLWNLIKQFIFSHNIRNSNLMQHNIPMDKQNKYFQRWMIFLSLLIQILLHYFECPLKKFGSMVEDLLNANVIPRKKERSVDENGVGLSFLGHLDRRIELNKDIKHGDGRYYPSLSIMASKLAYENPLLIHSVVNRHWKMEFVKFYDFYNEFQKKTTTQAFIMCERNIEGEKIIVAFRGTSPFDADDWSTDFDFSWCKIDGMGKTHMGFMIALGLQKYYHEDDSDKLGDYYGYFRKQIEQDPQRPLAYYTIRDKLKEIIANNKRAQIIVTGHSLGGALAILFPAILALHEEVELLDKLEAIYTYGQPRVGNEQFGEFMNKNLREHNIKYYRIVYGFDCVPSVPLDNTLMTFKHFGTCIHFNSLYQGKILEEEHQKLVKETRNELFIMMKYLRLLRGILLKLMNFIIARFIAIWELVRGIFIGFVAGPYYKEGWLLLAFRTVGILFPGAANHNPQDYVNATMLTSENIFKYHL